MDPERDIPTTHGPNGILADSLDEAKAVFRAAWEAARQGRLSLKKADEKCSGRLRLLMTQCRREPGGGGELRFRRR